MRVANLADMLSKIFTYQEPKNKDFGFELLENEEKSALNDGQPHNAGQHGADRSAGETTEAGEPIAADLNAAVQTLRKMFLMPKNQGITIREFKISRKLRACFVFADEMVDKQLLNNGILPRLMSAEIGGEIEQVLASKGSIPDFLTENVLAVHNVSKATKYGECVRQILSGATALLIDGCGECLVLETRGYEKRAVNSPKTENVVKGSQEAFTENLRTNITLVRRNIKNEHLVTEMLCVGKTSESNCAVLYIDGLANPQIVAEIKKRLNAIDTDFVLGEGMIENFIEDNSFMMLPQTLSTERPDRISAFLVYGEVAIIADGIPLATAVPANFFQLLHSPEDVHLRWPYASFLRLVRYIGAFGSLLLPGLYCAVILFHPEMLPTELLVSIADSKESVPFPTFVEVLILEISFELIREGSIRVPLVVGQTLGIVGALILGQAAVMAQLVSPVVVIIVSLTALGSFTIPDYSLSLAFRVLRFVFIFAGAFLGFYGIAVLLFVLICVACSMKSFGVPFLAPIAPKTRGGDMLLKHPIWVNKDRPDYLNTLNQKSQGYHPETWVSEQPDAKGR